MHRLGRTNNQAFSNMRSAFQSLSPRYADRSTSSLGKDRIHVHARPQIPANISTEQAATLPLGINTAVFGLYDHEDGGIGNCGLSPPWEEGGLGKYIGRPILIFGGASSVGQYGEHLMTTAVYITSRMTFYSHTAGEAFRNFAHRYDGIPPQRRLAETARCHARSQSGSCL